MKKQIQKLSLNKKTISNLNSSEMSHMIGASGYWCTQGRGCHGGWPTKKCTQNQNTCPGHNTCYGC